MKALTFTTVCLLMTTNVFSQDPGAIMGAQAAMDSANAAAAMQQQAQATQMLLQQQQADQLAQMQARQQAEQKALLEAQQKEQLRLKSQQSNQAVAPAVFYAPASGDKTLAPQPIEVEVPVYNQIQPRAEVKKIVSEIRASQFFLEVNPLSLSSYGGDFESNSNSTHGPELELDASEFRFKMMPLDFKFGFENPNWGGFAEVLISSGEDKSEAVLYTKIGSVKLGGGLTLGIIDEEAKLKSNTVLVGKDESSSMEVGPYFYAAFEVVNDDSVVIEQWNKIGGVYEKEESDGVTTYKGVSFLFNPALDVLFKINPKLQIGLGVEFEYRRFSGDINSSTQSYKGIGNTYGFELNLIKTKFLF